MDHSHAYWRIGYLWDHDVLWSVWECLCGDRVAEPEAHRSEFGRRR